MRKAGARGDDPLSTLREYRQLAPWNLRDLATVAGGILEAAGVRPINAAASAKPNERTIRFYVTRGVVTPPDGRGTAATYNYRHLLQVLEIKLRQMEGATLAAIARELSGTTGDVLERHVAQALGASLPTPKQLPLASEDRPAWGRAGRALRAWLAEDVGGGSESGGETSASMTWLRMTVDRGIELHVHDTHPLARLEDRRAEVANAVRLAVARILGRGQDSAPTSATRLERTDEVPPQD